MRRGDIVTIAISGDYGKPRPAVIVQADVFDAIPSVTVLPLTSALNAAPLVRIDVNPAPENALRLPSQVMVDKAVTVPRARIGAVVGHLGPDELRAVDHALGRFLGLAPQ